MIGKQKPVQTEFHQLDNIQHELVEIKMMLNVLFGKVNQMALDQAAVAAAVAKVKADVEKVVLALSDQRVKIDDLIQKVTDLSTVNDADTQAIVADLEAMDTALDAAVPDVPVP